MSKSINLSFRISVTDKAWDDVGPSLRHNLRNLTEYTSVEGPMIPAEIFTSWGFPSI